MELAFGGFEEQVGSLQSYHDLSDMLPVCFQRVALDENVVYKHRAQDVQKVKQRVVDEVLKGCGGVAKAEEHDFILVVT